MSPSKSARSPAPEPLNLIAVINADDLSALLREQPELAAARDEHGVSALLLAIYHRRPEARDALLAAGAPVGPLEAAALGDVKRLEGADLSVRGGDGFTPLHLAAFFGGARAVEAILATGADPDADADNPFKVRPLHSACATGDRESAAALLAAGANPNLAQQAGYTPLHSAAHIDDPELTKLLLEHGADPRAAEDSGKTPYDMAGEATRALLSP
jgi:ankyrin repeat protein